MKAAPAFSCRGISSAVEVLRLLWCHQLRRLEGGKGPYSRHSLCPTLDGEHASSEGVRISLRCRMVSEGKRKSKQNPSKHPGVL